jgi:hypothetical protein
MLTIAAILFGAAILIGIAMATIHFRNARLPSMTLAVIHGLLALAGIVALVAAIAHSSHMGLDVAALMVFAIAALGGFILFGIHLSRTPLSSPVIVLHGVVATIAFLCLIGAVL